MMVERRCRRRHKLRNALFLAVGSCGFFACLSWYFVVSSRIHFQSDTSVDAPSSRRTARNVIRRTTSPSVPTNGGSPSNRERHRDSYRRRSHDPMALGAVAASPNWKTDQYIVKAWLPRGIKERVEVSSSYETADVYSKIISTEYRSNSSSSYYSRPTSAGWTSSNVSSFLSPTSYDNVKKTKRKKSVVSPPVKRLPQALIIGVKKCGTRALLEFLRVHPDIRASGPETHFFDRHYQRGLEWYRQQMPSSLEGQITMEKTPSYFITKEVPPRIHSMSPSVRVLVVVRDPVTRAVSDYTQSTSKRKGTPSFEEMAFLNISTGLVDTSWSAIRIGVYARFLEWWMKYFSLDQMLFISGETLIKDPAGEMGRVQDFLGLKRVISDKHFYFNETKGFPCLKKSEGSGNPHCLGKTKGRTHPEISQATVQRLRDFYRPFNMKFYQMVGRNFGWP